MPLWAQPGQSFRANIHGDGNRDSGKCTIEVRVGQVAEVAFSGDEGRLRTLYGEPASWTRIDCSAPMPRSMRNFRFSGVDGRGSQNLVADPRSNGGVAVVRIEDPKDGTEGYTFDLEWSGGSGYNGGYNDGYGGPSGGYGNGRDRGRDRDGNRGGYGDNYGNNGDGNNGYGNNAYTIRCESNGRRQYCNADTRNGVQLVQQQGEACRQGETWGFDRRGIWVDRGCRGVFATGTR